MELHFHLAYIGNGCFRFTMQNKSDPSRPSIEDIAADELAKSLRKMKPGSTTIRLGKSTINCDKPVPVELVDYFQAVYDGYRKAKLAGKDLDAELKKMSNRVDPTAGSGRFSMN